MELIDLFYFHLHLIGWCVPLNMQTEPRTIHALESAVTRFGIDAKLVLGENLAPR